MMKKYLAGIVLAVSVFGALGASADTGAPVPQTVSLGAPAVLTSSTHTTPLTGNPIVIGSDQKLVLTVWGISKAVRDAAINTGACTQQIFLESSDGTEQAIFNQSYSGLDKGCSQWGIIKTRGADTYEIHLPALDLSKVAAPALYSGFRFRLRGSNNVFLATADTSFGVQVNPSSSDINNPSPTLKTYGITITPKKTSYRIGTSAAFKVTTDAPKGHGIHQVFVPKFIDSSGTQLNIGGIGGLFGSNLSFDTHNLNPGQYRAVLTLEVRQDLKTPTADGLTYTVIGTGAATSSPITLTSGKAGASVFDAVRSFWDSL